MGRAKHQSCVGISFVFLLASFVFAEPPEKNDNTVIIPLSSIVTTSPQKEMLRVKELLDQQTSEQIAKSTSGYLSKIYQANSGGASNVFIVDAGDAAAAIVASCSVLVGPWSANTPAYENKPDPNRGSYWMVAYLGWGDDDSTTWEVKEVRRQGKQITLSYHKKRLPEDSDQSHQYFYWIPLGQLSPGSYEVELVDLQSHSTTLARRVEVTR